MAVVASRSHESLEHESFYPIIMMLPFVPLFVRKWRHDVGFVKDRQDGVKFAEHGMPGTATRHLTLTNNINGRRPLKSSLPWLAR